MFDEVLRDRAKADALKKYNEIVESSENVKDDFCREYAFYRNLLKIIDDVAENDEYGYFLRYLCDNLALAMATQLMYDAGYAIDYDNEFHLWKKVQKNDKN